MLNYGEFYIDLGTTNTLIYTKTRGFLVNEPTMLTTKSMPGKEIQYSSFGSLSKITIGKTPDDTTLIKPLREGVVSDFKSTLKLVEFFMQKLDKVPAFKKSRLLISLPHHISQHERQVIRELGSSLGARTVDLISEPMAAAIGSGLKVLESNGKMVVDVGGGTSEAAIISLGDIVNSTAVRIGGSHLDESILDHLKTNYLFVIGEQTAEKLKIKVGDLVTSGEPLELEVGGMNLKSGIPGRLKVTAKMIYPPLDAFAKEIIKIIFSTLEACPPELASDLVDNGILLVGGGSMLRGLPERVAKETGVKTELSAHPLLSVAHGGAEALNDPELFEKLQKV